MLHFKKMAPRFIIFLLLALFSNVSTLILHDISMLYTLNFKIRSLGVCILFLAVFYCQENEFKSLKFY